jgi:heavy metal translocating P-type ATPase
MRCAACARRLERLLPSTPGVESAHVNFAAESATIRWNPGIVRFDAIAAVAANAGFELVPDQAWESGVRGGKEARAARDTMLRLVVGLFFSMNAMAPALAIYAGLVDGMSPQTAWRLALASGACAFPVLAYSGWPFFAGAWRNLRSGGLGMDFLVAVGAGLAFGYSAWQLGRGSSEVYFDSASMIITLLLVGRAIEKRGRQRGGDAVRELLATAPETVRVLGEDGIERECSARAIAVGDLVRVRPGERVAVDGVVTAGASSLDRSLLTGESTAVGVGVGDCVEAGTVNCEGALTLRVTAAAGNRSIDGIARAVEGLLSKRAPLAALSDRAVRVFVPVVVVIASVVGLAHGVGAGAVGAGLLRAVSVLIIACPCALGLATPMAILVAAGNAARRGILFRDGEALERGARVDVVLFDKTGTLTEGRPQVIGVEAAPEASVEEVLAVAAGAEAQSEHPIARAILSAAPLARGGRPEGELVAHAGLGVTWTVGAEKTLVGNERLLRAHDIVVPPVNADVGTWVEVARDGRWLGRILVRDALRPTTPPALDALRAMSITVGMVSGDARAPALEIGHALGIDEDDVEFECVPTQKAASIQRRGAGHVVAFAGDGLNDTVALCAADLAVAASGATDLAMQVAHVVLREGGIARLPEALALARKTRRVMHQNIAWAIGYNVLALPIAIAGFAPPIAAALAMALSSITVVANSLTLRGVASRGGSRRAPPPGAWRNSPAA